MMSYYKRKRFVLATRLVEASMDNNQMIQDVYQIFSNLQTKYPIIQPNLEKCFKEIQAKFVGEQVSSKEDKKGGKVKKLLKSLMDMKHLEMSYQGLIDETASNENELIQLLKKLSEASLSCMKKTTMFASRQGRLLRDAKTFLSKQMFKHVRDMCGFTTRYVNFLISFYQLLEEYPRLCYCAVRFRTFMLNMKIIREICEEEVAFWKNLS